MNTQEIIKKLEKFSVPENKEGMARFGINTEKALGVSVANIRKVGKTVKKDHELALKLWNTGIHEARILATMLDEPDAVNEEQMESWAKDFNSWDLCDQACGNLFDKTRFAFKKPYEWARRDEEFVKRAAFALIAWLAVHDKKAGNKEFERFLTLIKNAAGDERNFVKKAVNWALRQIGKRNPALNKKAVKTAEEIQKMDSKAAKWIAKDALKELRSEAVQKRLKSR